jgi:ABC-type amino acid transport system permease subunit
VGPVDTWAAKLAEILFVVPEHPYGSAFLLWWLAWALLGSLGIVAAVILGILMDMAGRWLVRNWPRGHRRR